MWKPAEPTAEDRAALKQRLDEDLDDLAPRLVAAYFDRGNGFAAETFDNLDGGGEASAEITSADLLAVSLLDTPYPPEAVRQLLGGEGIALAGLLAHIPPGLRLGDEGDERALAVANEVWERLMKLDDVGRTRVSKLLARKRPHLIPITDSILDDRLSPQQSPLSVDLWSALRDQLRGKLAEQLERVRGEAHVPGSVSQLRVLDVAIWMRHSKSSRLKLVRANLERAG